MRQLQPADITAPNINININVPQIGGDEDKKDKKEKDPDQEKVDDVIGAVKESKSKVTIISPPDGNPEGLLGASTIDDNSSTSSGDMNGGDKKKVTFG